MVARDAMPNTDFRIRRATPSDADAIARTHLDSIETIGPQFYPAEIVSEWSSGLTPDRYRGAMDRGEVFFIALDEQGTMLGFSTHRVDGNRFAGESGRRYTGWRKLTRSAQAQGAS
jgi:hypothetical protein